jgi:CRISPR-associated protein (TIGR03986 family)
MYERQNNKNSSRNNHIPKKPFINPYNFIPFENTIQDKRISREEAYQNKGELLSGWLTVELQTKTPLIIPDGAHPKYWDINKQRYISEKEAEKLTNVHKEYDFFRISEKENENIPTIPGSELRGMLRSVYEAVTDSCVPFLLDEKPISRRVPTYGALRHRGLLAYEKEKNQWVLYKAVTSKRIEVSKKDVMSEPICVDEKMVSYKNGDFVKNYGWVQYNIPVGRPDTKYHIAYLNKTEELKRWDIGDAEPYRTLKSALERDGAGAGTFPNSIPNENLKKALEKAKNGENNLIPVYYISVMRGSENLVYLSNSSIGRIAQKRKWKDIMGEYAPCESTDKMCPACLLFGTTKGKGMKGKLQVTNAVPTDLASLKFEKHTLQILATPRTSAFEFYLRKPNGEATFWNFDFYGESIKTFSKLGKQETRIEYHDLAEATPRGRKMYWHSKPAEDAGEKNRMNCTVEAAKGTFQFRIYFDEITEQQLENLMWVITLGENKKDSVRQHKLGHAKPLGYGSVKLQVLQQAIRRLSYDKECGSLEVKVEQREQEKLEIPLRLNADSKAEESLLAMASTTSIPKDIPVMYPREINKGDDNIYTWFANNRKNYNTVTLLPEPTAQDISLKGNWMDVPVAYRLNETRLRQPSNRYTENQRKGSEERIYGEVKFYKIKENFGFITDRKGNEHYFRWNHQYHPDIKPEDLVRGRKISFTLKELANGKKVVNYCRLE